MLEEKFTYKNFVKAALYFYFFYRLIYPFFVRYFNFPQLPTMSLEVLLVALLVITFLVIKIKNKKILQNSYVRYLRYFSLLLLLLIIFSSVNASDNVFLLFKSLISYFLPVILIFNLILELNFSEEEQTNLIKYLLGIILIQIPITLYQAIIISPSNADANSGTMSYAELGGTGILSILEGFLLAIFVISFLFKDFQFKYIIFALLTFIPAIAGGARFGLLIAPLIIFLSIFVYLLYFKESARKKLFKIALNTLVITTFLAIIFLFIIPNTKYSNFLNLDIATSANSFLSYDESAGEYSRTAGYYILFNNYFKEPIEYVAGLGTGVITTSKTAGASSSALESIQNLPDAVLIIASIGISGLIMIISLIISPILIVRKYVKIETNDFMKIIGAALIPISIIVILGLFYAPTWSSQIGIIYWTILAIIVDRYRVFKMSQMFTLEAINKNYFAKKNYHISSQGT